jgi:hypothetical protein
MKRIKRSYNAGGTEKSPVNSEIKNSRTDSPPDSSAAAPNLISQDLATAIANKASSGYSLNPTEVVESDYSEAKGEEEYTLDKNIRLRINSHSRLYLDCDSMPIFDVDIDRAEEGIPRVTELAFYEAILEFKDSSGHLRIYRTRCGYRVIEVGRHLPVSDAILETMAKIHCDPRYLKLCAATKTYRARLSPKVLHYGGSTTQIAVCKFVCEVGNHQVQPEHVPALLFHDMATRAFSKADILV